MLLEYGVKNFFSFKEEANISFKLDANCPASVSQGRDFATVMCVKGANGSGKTQILKALAFLKHFCTESFGSKPDEDIGISPFFSNAEPSAFYVEFALGEAQYRYELQATRQAVVQEVFYKTQKKKVKILERNGNDITYRIQALQGLDAIKLRKNVSIISTASQYEMEELRDVFQFFSNIVANVWYGGLDSGFIPISEISAVFSQHEELFSFVKNFIRECDVGIEDIKIGSFNNREGKPEFFPIFVHMVNGQLHEISDLMESSGTKTLFRNLSNYKVILEHGGVLVLDEFDINLHPHILPKLLDLFINPAINTKQAQLLFSTHDSEILNILGRYRVYLVAKEDNESYTYRLDEIPGDILRNDRPIRPAYNERKIGGVPRL